MKNSAERATSKNHLCMYGQTCSLISTQTHTCDGRQKTGLDICFKMLRGEEGGFLQEYKGPQREKMENMVGFIKMLTSPKLPKQTWWSLSWGQ